MAESPPNALTDLENLADLDAVETAALIRKGTISPLEAVEAAIGRVEALNGAINAVIHSRFDEALEEAKELSYSDKPFRGVPLLMKDMDGQMAGSPFHAGMTVLKERGFRGTQDSDHVRLLKEAGFVIIGRTNCPELGLMTTTEPKAYGSTRNPWDRDYSPGGSSGGSAAAVAARLVPVASAGDGGGSIRIPASCCGLVGLKPSRGRVSFGPTEGEAWGGFVQRHMVTRSVRDSAHLLDVISPPQIGDPYSAPPPPAPFAALMEEPLPRLRIGVLLKDGNGYATVSEEVRSVVEAAAGRLGVAGHQIEGFDPGLLADPSLVAQVLDVLGACIAAEVAELAEHSGGPISQGDVEPATWAQIEHGQSVSATDYLRAQQALNVWRRKAEAAWAEMDILLTPTLPVAPVPLGSYCTPEDPTGLMRNVAMTAFTIPFNITGQPAISLPLGMSEKGLPIGVQAIAARNREDLLLQVARFFEQEMPWAERRPALCA